MCSLNISVLDIFLEITSTESKDYLGATFHVIYQSLFFWTETGDSIDKSIMKVKEQTAKYLQTLLSVLDTSIQLASLDSYISTKIKEGK